MKWIVVAAIAAAVALLALGVLSLEGWRVDAPRISNLPGAPNRSLSPRECDEMCREAIVQLPGVSPQIQPANLHALLVRRYGELSAKELYDAYRDRRMIMLQGKVFFPTGQLCRQDNLRGECATLCAELNRTR